jgi:hypothetical protein
MLSQFRFRYHVLLLVVLLLGWELFHSSMGSNRWLGSFAAGPSLVEFSSLGDFTARTATGGRLIPGKHGALRINLSAEALDSASWYLLRISAGEGPEFALQVINRANQKTAKRVLLPARSSTQEYSLALDPAHLPESNRLQLWYERPEEFELHDLQIHRLRPIWRWVRPGILLLGPLLVGLFGWLHRQRLSDYFCASDEPSFPHQQPLWNGLAALIFTLICFHIFFWAPVQQLIDQKFSTVVSHRLLTARTFSLPKDFSHAQGDELPYQLQRVGDQVYHFYPNAVAALNVPIVAAYQLAGIEPLGPDGRFLRQNERRILRFAAAFQAALLCALLFYLARSFLRPGPALALAALFAFGTQIFSTLSRSYWSHTWASLLLTAAICLLLAPKLYERKTIYLASATLLSWSFFCRPQIALSIIGITVYLILTKRRHLATFVTTGIAWALLFITYSLNTFQQLLPPYFFSNQMESGRLGLTSLATSYPSAVFGTLISPGRGLFVYSPIFALALLLAARYRHWMPQRKLAVTGLVVILVHWQLISAHRGWGGLSFGARHYSDVLVWFFVLSVLVVLSLQRVSRERFIAWKSGIFAASGCVIAASLFINFRGAAASATLRWQEESVWDWSRPQFLAGLIPERREKTLEERLAAMKFDRSVVDRERQSACRLMAGPTVTDRLASSCKTPMRSRHEPGSDWRSTPHPGTTRFRCSSMTETRYKLYSLRKRECAKSTSSRFHHFRGDFSSYGAIRLGLLGARISAYSVSASSHQLSAPRTKNSPLLRWSHPPSIPM